MSSSAAEQCRALTDDGERCSHEAKEDGFCHQHDESDETVDEADTGDRPSVVKTVAGSGIDDLQATVTSVGRDLIGSELDGIVGIDSTGDGIHVTAEFVERSAVPDTQDILGRYEIELDADRDVTGYRQLGRYRRSDTNPTDAPE